MLLLHHFRDMTTEETLGDPIYFRIDKVSTSKIFSSNLLKILEIRNLEWQLFQIVNHEYQSPAGDTVGSEKMLVTVETERTVQAAIRSTIENLLYEQ